MADLITADEYLIINGTPSATPAWRLTHLTALWTSPDVRGSDRVIPGVDGERPKRRRATATRIALPGMIFGESDRGGIAHPDVRTGLRLNLDELYTAWLARPDTTAGTVAATWVLPGGNKTADIHVLRLSPRDFAPDAIGFSLEISIPAGRFT